MTETTSSIRDMFIKMKEMEDELKTLKQQYTLEKKIWKTDQKTTQTCQICCDKQHVPVFLNGYKRKSNGIVDKTKLVPCPASQANMSCLSCTRQQIEFHKKEGKTYFLCPTKCHEIPLKVFKKWELYGEIGRDPDGPPCPAMYRMMDNNGIGCRTCSACGEECEGVYDLAMHIKNKCSKRKIQCEVCKQRMTINELEDHKKTCYRFCKNCGPYGPKIQYKNIDGVLYFTAHKCPNKTLGNCRICQKSITFSNITEHKECTMAYKSDFKTTSTLKKEQM